MDPLTFKDTRDTQPSMVYTTVVIVQVLNRDKLQRAGEDNLFVRLLYAKDKPQIPKNQDEQEKLGLHTDPTEPSL